MRNDWVDLTLAGTTTNGAGKPPTAWSASEASAAPAAVEQAAGVRGDAERLDWLENMANEKGGLLLHDGSERGSCGLGLRPGSGKRTLREAIDAAMRFAPPNVK